MANAPAQIQNDICPIGSRNGLRLSIRRRTAKDIGAVILRPDSPELVRDVQIETGTIYPDDRGYFSELFRLGQTPLTQDLAACPTVQLSLALSYPGTIKAVHYHFEQTDYWAPAGGMFQVMLCDFREDSSTHGKVNTLYVGLLRPWRLKIPPGIGHGYKVLGMEPASLVYVTNKFYNPADEGRLAFDHPFLNYDWELQHK
jgi:dTDP-4-dehydrorhamnose 3,5-epimerase